jgi:hypothetical protein
VAYQDMVKKRAAMRRYHDAHRDERNARKREHRASHSEEYAEKYRSNWARFACQSAKRRAKESNLPFDITPDDLQIPEVCPFTLLPLDLGPKNGKPSPQSPSVDRIKPDRGYVRGNVRVISVRANLAKQDITDPAIFDRLADDARLWGLV